jgi:alkanesulfonate monooxygenase SsuD/methylene tetrahydromethanopterin reductase-like flavin-dependent oxidoreductase (luciferase family)
MEFGLFTEFHCPPGTSEGTAFEQSMAQMVAAESLGYDAVWLAELHFQKDRSVLSSPLVVAGALAMATRRIKIGIAVQVLPLSNPIRIAEDAATVDNLTRGRLDFGVGRSGLPGHYRGFNIPYAESRDRFNEALDIILKAWTEDRFSYDGKYHQLQDVCVMPKPWQKPHPPLRIAATNAETFDMVGRLGYPLFIAVRTSGAEELTRLIHGYHEGWTAAGHPGRGDVALSIPVYVAETSARVREDAEASTMHFFRSIARGLQQQDGATAAVSRARAERAQRLASLTYDDVVRNYAIYGPPESVVAQLTVLRQQLGFSTLSVWMNCGGMIAHDRVTNSMRLFAEQVIPQV